MRERSSRRRMADQSGQSDGRGGRRVGSALRTCRRGATPESATSRSKRGMLRRSQRHEERQEKSRRQGKGSQRKGEEDKAPQTEQRFKGKRIIQAAATKSLSAFSGGTGMDPQERVPAQVSRAAKKSVWRRKAAPALRDDLAGENVFFLRPFRAISIAESPRSGALNCQTGGQMKSRLLQEAGVEGLQY